MLLRPEAGPYTQFFAPRSRILHSTVAYLMPHEPPSAPPSSSSAAEQAALRKETDVPSQPLDRYEQS